MARGRQQPRRNGLKRAAHAVRREVAHDGASALSHALYLYDEAALRPMRACVEYLMLPWWKRLLTPRPDVANLDWYRPPSPDQMEELKSAPEVVAARKQAWENAGEQLRHEPSRIVAP